jgi:hypothetical protein
MKRSRNDAARRPHPAAARESSTRNIDDIGALRRRTVRLLPVTLFALVGAAGAAAIYNLSDDIGNNVTGPIANP